MSHHCPDRLCPCLLVRDEDRRRQSPAVAALLREQIEADRLLARRWSFAEVA